MSDFDPPAPPSSSRPSSSRPAPPAASPAARRGPRAPTGRPARAGTSDGAPGPGGPGAVHPALVGLNPAQLAAATTLEGPVLVIAGAGTGKTRTLVHRLAQLVYAGVPAESILLLTFTRRAANEMTQRASELIGPGCGRIAGGTFHSFGSLLLRRFGQAVGLDPGFTILDQGDSLEVIGKLRSELGLAEKGRHFPRRETVAGLISRATNHQLPLAQVIAQEAPHLAEETELLELIAERYRAYKTERALVDFDDLLELLVRLLRDHPAVRARVHQRYRYVMVDEYQDTNVLQAEATRLLAGPAGNLMVVGDDAQSIYAFRGACFRNLFDFAAQHPEAQSITLEQNYRSVQPVLDLANALLGQMAQSFRKRLFTERPGGERPQLVEAADESEQARFVAAEVARLHAAGTPLAEIAVLFRASYHAFALELELGQRKLPFVKYGGFRFMEAAHIKDALAPLRVVANPRDELALLRCLLLYDGVGAVTARNLVARVAGSADLGELAARLASATGRGKAKDGPPQLARLLGSLVGVKETPAQCLRLAVEDYLPRLKERFDDWPRRKRDLEQLLELCASPASLEALLNDLALDPPSTSTAGGALTPPPTAPRAGSADREAGADRLVLSTLHSAKGLEWKHVFILQALDGCIPHLANPFDEEDDGEGLDEELRLLYVGVTRARERLALVYPRTTVRGYGGGWAEPSRFVVDLPARLLERKRAADLLRGAAGGGGKAGRRG